MEPNLVAAKRTLKWSLDFINDDLSRLPETDLFALWVEIRDRVYGEQGSRFLSDESLVKWEERRTQAKEIQDSMKKALNAILKNSAIAPTKRLRPIAGRPSHMELVQPPNMAFLASPSGEPALFSIRYQMGIYRKGDRVYAFPTDIGIRLVFDFIIALGYFPVSLIQKCQREDCGGYFLKATEKEKRYCSNRCAWIVASRERWKLHPELVKKQRREYYHRMKEMVSIGPARRRK